MALERTPELDRRYKKACENCVSRHCAIYGGLFKTNESLATPIFHCTDNTYCSDIENAELLRRDNLTKQQRLEEHINQLYKEGKIKSEGYVAILKQMLPDFIKTMRAMGVIKISAMIGYFEAMYLG